MYIVDTPLLYKQVYLQDLPRYSNRIGLYSAVVSDGIMLNASSAKFQILVVTRNSVVSLRASVSTIMISNGLGGE